MALKYGIKPIVYHQYIIEDLSFNKEVLGYYQSKGIEINLIESGMVAKMQKADLLCINKVLDIKGSKVNPLKKTEELIYELEKFDYNLIGIKQNDSPNRRLVINKHGWLHTKDKKAYPIYNWSDKMAFNYIYENDLPVNKCYEWFGRSQDVINYKHLQPLKEKSPDDFKKFIEKFPLIETLFWVKETKDEYFYFSEFAKQSNLYNYGQDLDRFLILAFETCEQKMKFCERCVGNPFSMYLEGESSQLYPTEENNLYQRNIKFAEDKKNNNNLDFFLKLWFNDINHKNEYCEYYGLPKNVNAIRGINYDIFENI
jgi:Phosphoadenosine phosphosulfate reductase family